MVETKVDTFHASLVPMLSVLQRANDEDRFMVLYEWNDLDSKNPMSPLICDVVY